MVESTEKLLNFIRSQSRGDDPPSRSSPPAPWSLRRKRLRGAPRPWSVRRRLGVDITPRNLRLMLLTDSESAPQILGFRDIAHPAGAAPGSPAFPSFLRREVKSLCGRVDNLRIWSHVFSFRTQLQHVLVPKVPPWELYDLVYWRVKRDNPFDDKEFLLDFKVQGTVADTGATRFSVICCIVPRQELALARSFFVEAGLPLAGMTVAPLALQSMFRNPLLRVDESRFATLHVERDWSRIDIFAEGNLVLSRVVKTGLSSMAETLAQRCNAHMADQPENDAAQPDEGTAMPEVEMHMDLELAGDEQTATAADADKTSPDVASTQPEEQAPESGDVEQEVSSGPTCSAMSMDQAMETLFRSLSDGRDMTSFPWETITDEQIFNMITPVCERLARQVERTFDYNMREQGQERTELLLLSGDLAVNIRIREVFWGILGAPTVILDPLDPEQYTHWGPSIPSTPLDRVRFNQALALALCTSKNCLNLQGTYFQREEARSVTRVNMAMFVATIILLLVMSGVYAFLGREVEAREDDLARLDRELAGFIPRLTEDMLMRSASEVRGLQEDLRGLSGRLETLAMLREMSALTPEHIRLFNVRVDGGARRQTDARARPPGNEGAKVLVMDGMIVGDPMGFETALAGYIIALQRSPLFEVPQVHDKRLENGIRGEERMRFVLHVPMKERQKSSARPGATASRG